MKQHLFIFIIVMSAVSMNAFSQDEAIRLFPGGAPGEKGALPAENVDVTGNKVGGETVQRMGNVTEPAITVYHPVQELACGTAMIVCPGGGYNILAYDLEGTEICDWLNDLGITAVLLKYRVPRREGLEKHAAPLQDAQRAVSYVRAHAGELNINPARIGIMGFSAGAHLSAMASNHPQEHTYPAVDACDGHSSRPNFCLLVYPAYLSGETVGALSPEIKVSSATPPTMLVQAEDDKSHINSSLSYYYALKEAGVPATMHLYSKGGHGYGLRDTKAVVNEWPERAEYWLRSLGFIE
ncbi:MAG: alpha/beta hydrolase [Tannerella sp.]|jgi:acetyl esterase/lipase|nr:alpha/beta hydrolase [Tannerella sp.]